MTWWNRPNLKDLDGIICDGAVRSGKTMALTCGFFLWSMACFDRQVFALCGKTVGALRRNLVLPMSDWLGGLLRISEHRSENKLTVRMGSRVNTYYLFGGQDESACALIQGITLAGVLLDEAVLMPRSFVEQAAARCSVAGAKLWFTCNPGSPEHWFYKHWICAAAQKRLLRLHFTMQDNPALPPAVRQRYARLYTGVFYRRFVLGQWCAAQGRIYDFDSRHIYTGDSQKMSENVGLRRYAGQRGENQPTKTDKNGRAERTKMSENVGLGKYTGQRGENQPTKTDKNPRWYISVDYGTYNPFSAGLWRVADGVAVRLREYYHDGRATGQLKTDEEYYQALEALAGDAPVEKIIIDPSAASMIALIRKRGRFSVRRARNAVLPGIRLVGSLLQQGRLLIGKDCCHAIREFGLYCWEDDEAKDVPKKEHDHAMDDIRYFCMSVMAR